MKTNVELRKEAQQLREKADSLDAAAEKLEALNEEIEAIDTGAVTHRKAGRPKGKRGKAGRPKGSKNRPKTGKAKKTAKPTVKRNKQPMHELVKKILGDKRHKEGLVLDEIVEATRKAGYKSKAKGKEYSGIVYQTLYKLMSEKLATKEEATKKYRITHAAPAAA